MISLETSVIIGGAMPYVEFIVKPYLWPNAQHIVIIKWTHTYIWVWIYIRWHYIWYDNFWAKASDNLAKFCESDVAAKNICLMQLCLSYIPTIYWKNLYKKYYNIRLRNILQNKLISPIVCPLQNWFPLFYLKVL